MILLVSAKQMIPLGKIKSYARISSSGYSLYACLETGDAIKLDRMRTIKLDFLVSVSFSSPEAALLLISTKNRDL